MDIKNLLEHRYFGLVVLLYTVLITWLSLTNISIPINSDFAINDKAGHLAAYFVFVLILFAFLFYSKKGYVFKYSLLFAAILVVGYGVLMEFLQALLTTYRSAEWFDVLANTTGVFLAVLVLKLFQNKIVEIKKIK